MFGAWSVRFCCPNQALDADGMDMEIDFSNLGTVNTMFAALFSNLGVPIKTTISANFLEEALNGTVTANVLEEDLNGTITIKPLPIGFSQRQMSDLKEAAASYGTLNTILHIDVLNDGVRTSGSLSRNLRRVRQGLDLIRALFQNFLSSD